MRWLLVGHGLWLGAALVGVACHQDHSALAKRDRPPDHGVAGSGGVAVTIAGAAGAVGAGAAEGGSALIPDEPAGDDVLTLGHGVVDAPRVFFCFARVEDGERSATPTSPLPEQGLAFGGLLSLDTLPGVDPATDEFVVTVVAADPTELEGLSCDEAIERAEQLAASQPPLDGRPAGAAGAGGEAGPTEFGGAAGSGVRFGAGGAGDAGGLAEAGGRDGGGGVGPGGFAVAGAAGAHALGLPGGVAGAGGAAGREEPEVPLIPPPAVRVHDLVRVPAGTLTAGRSTLLIARGCLGGGTTLSSDRQEEICGAGYRPAYPTLAPVFTALSRIAEPDRVGIQVVHAASFDREDDSLTLSLRADTGAAVELARNVSPGAIAPPRPAFEALASFGEAPDAALLEVYPRNATVPVLAQAWGDARARSDVGPTAVGQSYAIVVVGPGLRRDQGMGWWNPPTLSVVETTAR